MTEYNEQIVKSCLPLLPKNNILKHGTRQTKTKKIAERGQDVVILILPDSPRSLEAFAGDANFCLFDGGPSTIWSAMLKFTKSEV